MSHVRWPHLLPLSLRLLAAQALLETGERFEVLTLDDDARAIWIEFETLCEGQLADAGRSNRSEEDANKEGPALDAYFQRVTKELSDRMSNRASASREAQALLKGLTNSLSRPVCSECCRSSTLPNEPTPCRWTRSSEAEDTAALAERGWCLRSVRDVFEFSRDSAANAYADACKSWTPAALHLRTQPGGHNAELDLAVMAFVNEVEDDPVQARTVTLSFNSKKVTVDDYLALAYLLVHECVAHGFCGVNVEDEDSSLSASFHEGWMDCVAAYVAADALRNHQGQFGQFAGLFTQQMDLTRSTRFNLRRNARPRDAQAWLAGARAFDTLEHLFQTAITRSGKKLVGQAGVAREALVSLSLEVNASTLTHRERSDFLRSINIHFTRTSRDLSRQQWEGRPQVLDFIDEYLDDGDYLTFVDRVSCL